MVRLTVTNAGGESSSYLTPHVIKPSSGEDTSGDDSSGSDNTGLVAGLTVSILITAALVTVLSFIFLRWYRYGVALA